MTRRRQRWQVHPDAPEAVAQVSAAHQVPRLIARILLNRGLAEPEAIMAFLDPALARLHPPFGLTDLEVAQARLGDAVRRGEPVALYGDYDADGLTGVALLHQFFRQLGLDCPIHIPNRLTEGYGLRIPALTKLASQARLVVTVDCGISDAAEVAWAKQQGLEVIVTDHHEIPPELPSALAVVNPKRGGGYPFAELAGVGVALLLAVGVRAYLRDCGWLAKQGRDLRLSDYLDLAAIGTAADVVPILGENRILVRQGLKILEYTQRPGLIALKEVTGLEGKPISFRDVVFRLAPRLNAAGRLGQARAALELLLCQDLNQARTQARYLHQLNQQRQAVEEAVLKEAAALIRQQGLHRRPVMVLGGEGWHPGVIGIVAARLTEEYHRPVALVSLENGQGKGSARSIEGFHLFQGLQACRKVLGRYGGHEAAAGFEVAADKVAVLQDLLEQAFAVQMGSEAPPPALKADAAAALGDLTPEFFGHLERLRPFGPGNPAPVLILTAVECLASRVVAERHLKVQLAQDGRMLEAIAFYQAAHHPLSGAHDVAVCVRLSFFQGRPAPELLLLDWGRP